MLKRVVRFGITPVVLFAAATFSSACYRYAPLNSHTPEPGLDIRVRLTDEGAVRLAPTIGNRIEYVDGVVVSAADTALTLSVNSTRDHSGTEVMWRGERVVLPREMISGVEQRKLDRRRSYLTGGIAAGLVAAVGIGFNIAGSGSNGGAGGTGSPR